MDFSNTHTYPASFEKVVETNYSKEFIEQLDTIEDVLVPELQEHSSEDTKISCKTSWQFSGKLDAIANALLMETSNLGTNNRDRQGHKNRHH